MRFGQIPTDLGRIETGIGDLREYPQLLRCTPEHARGLGHDGLSYLVTVAMAGLRRKWDHVSIDTRLSMLMPGMYPCIPGWHCDDFYRPNGGQPDLENAPPAEHIAVVLGSCSLPKFVDEPIDLPLPTDDELRGQSLYGVMHKRIEQLGPICTQLKSGQVVRFSQISWHCGQPATEMGWRYFFRLTGSNHWTPLNQRRTQTQVYLTQPFAGW